MAQVRFYTRFGMEADGDAFVRNGMFFFGFFLQVPLAVLAV
jgi:hypothetical protein